MHEIKLWKSKLSTFEEIQVHLTMGKEIIYVCRNKNAPKGSKSKTREIKLAKSKDT